MKLWNRAKLFRIFIQLLRDPNRTDLIFQGVDIVSSDPDQAPVKSVEELALSHPEFQVMYQENYIPKAPSLTDLKSYPEESFGRALYDHMNSNGLDFSLWPVYKSERPIKYISTRIYQDHDLWHALLGFGVSVEDELAIQAFGVAQIQSPISLMLVAGGLIHLMVKDPRKSLEAFRKVNELYSLGTRSPYLLSFKLHDFFPRPLTEVRQACGLA